MSSLTLEDLAAVSICGKMLSYYVPRPPSIYRSIRRNYEYDCSLYNVLVGPYRDIIKPPMFKLTYCIWVNNRGFNIIYVPKKYVTYEMCLMAVKNDNNVIRYIKKEYPFFVTKELCEIAK